MECGLIVALNLVRCIVGICCDPWDGLQWTKGLPIEVLPFAYKPVKLTLEKMGGAADLRMAQKKAVGSQLY